MKVLVEDSRRELVSKGKKGQDYKGDRSKGKNRYARRVHSKVAKSVKELNSINMNDLFKKDILNVDVKVNGETDTYLVKISFRGILNNLRKELQRNNRNNSELTIRDIIVALTSSFNGDNVYIHCECPDWKFRMAYFATLDQINSGEPEKRPSKITNPNNKLGPGCKHVLLVISNNSWLIPTASVIFNYINYIKRTDERAYKKVIYPAIYGKPYEEPEQLSLFKDDELITDKEILSKANKQAIERSRFQKGNKQGIRFAKEKEDQLEIEEK